MHTEIFLDAANMIEICNQNNKIMKLQAIVISIVLLASCKSGIINKENDFKVWGNCNMCKSTIEKSVDVDGVVKAEWNKDTKMMHVAYDSTKTSLDKIQHMISDSGYDTEMYRAADEKYDGLHECCHYERKPSEQEIQ